MNDLCTEHLPPAAELARLAENAQAGRREAFVGTGGPDTVLACPDGEWRLGDVLAELAAAARTCTGVKKDGDPCGAPKKADSEFCAAHQDQAEWEEAGADPVPPQAAPAAGQEPAGG